MELWDLYDKNKKLTNETMVRGNPIPENRYHLVVHVWIHNGEGKYLIAQRSKSRPKNPLLWEAVGGSVIAGEDSLSAAIREAEEEAGVKLLPKNGRLLFSKTRESIKGVVFRDIVDVWLFEYKGEADLKKATTDEVSAVKWLDAEEIKALMDGGELVPTLDYFFTDVKV